VVDTARLAWPAEPSLSVLIYHTVQLISYLLVLCTIEPNKLARYQIKTQKKIPILLPSQILFFSHHVVEQQTASQAKAIKVVWYQKYDE
jgi:hypothetical protein